MKRLNILIMSAVLLGSACVRSNTEPAEMVKVEDGHFAIGDSTYRYVGTNFWYGAILGSKGRGGDRERLARELDNLKSLGVENLRVLVGGDGREGIPSHIEPVLQTAPGVYNDTILDGLDYLMAELEKRGMKAVLYLNNAWEWSGGYGSYLEWAGEGEAPVPSIEGWAAYNEYVKKFVHSKKARELALNHVKFITGRTNRYTGKPYKESPALMSWQIANEPRAFGDKPADKEAFAEFIQETAKAIKGIDPNHLVSTGSEGKHGCEQDLELWKKIHSYPEIDYGIIHLWPYNWSWVDEKTLTDSVQKACRLSEEYIRPHAEIMKEMGKPLVLEEFGYPRDGFSFSKQSTTKGRDEFYGFIFNLVKESGMIDGCNFWGWGGEAEPLHDTWQPGDPYTGDPAQEPQGLNSVFATDSTTINVIKKGNSYSK